MTEKILIKLTSADYAVRNNLKVNNVYAVTYQDKDNYYVEDGGMIQEVPKRLCEHVNKDRKLIRG